MNLNTHTWEVFTINRLFDVEYGNSLELSACEITDAKDPDKVNFVARTRENNGVTAYVKRIEGIEPSPAGLITVAGSGSSTLSTFVQEDEFYSGYHLFVMRPLDNYSKECKQFICTCLEMDKYKYWYGRQANKTLPSIEIRLPIRRDMKGNPIVDATKKYSEKGYVPDWKFMEDYICSLHYKPLSTQNKKGQIMELDVKEWKEFKLSNLFEVKAGNYYYSSEYDDGEVPYISASDTHNGISQRIDLSADFLGNMITIGKVGATAYYQSEAFCATSDVNVLIPYFEMTKYSGLFIVRIINFSENYKWGYGRQCRVGDTKQIVIKLPVKHNLDGTPFIDDTYRFSEKGYVPDWEYMERYIKELPYGDRI